MKVTARLPLMFRGLPVRNRAEREIMVSHDVKWDIPEISSSEAETVFETRESLVPVVDREHPLRPVLRFDTAPTGTRTVSWKGHIYRKLPHDGTDVANAFRFAFPNGHEWDRTAGAGAEISQIAPGRDGIMGHLCHTMPPSLPVFRQFHWHSLSAYTEDNVHQARWPQSISADREYPGEGRGVAWSRNFVTFETVLPKLVSFDAEGLKAASETGVAQMAKFLLVDGELWMRTRPPVIRVSPYFERVDDGVRHRTNAIVSLVHAPDWADVNMIKGYFGLEHREAAFEYAAELVSTGAMGGETDTGRVIDHTVDFEASDTPLLAYNGEAEELLRTSCALASETMRFLTRNPKWKEKLGGAVAADVEAAFREVMATNYVTAEYGDPAEYLDSLIEAWTKTRRQSFQFHFGTRHVSDMLLDRARRLHLDRPISAPFITPAEGHRP